MSSGDNQFDIRYFLTKNIFRMALMLNVKIAELHMKSQCWK